MAGSLLSRLPVLRLLRIGGGGFKVFFVRPGKGRIVFKAAVKAYTGNGRPAAKQIPRQQKAFFGYVITKGIAGGLFEQVHQMVAA